MLEWYFRVHACNIPFSSNLFTLGDACSHHLMIAIGLKRALMMDHRPLVQERRVSSLPVTILAAHQPSGNHLQTPVLDVLQVLSGSHCTFFGRLRWKMRNHGKNTPLVFSSHYSFWWPVLTAAFFASSQCHNNLSVIVAVSSVIISTPLSFYKTTRKC